MRRPIIHLVVALLTFAIGTISALLFLRNSNTPAESPNGQIVAVRTELRSTTVTNSEPLAERCGCADKDEADSTVPASNQAKVPISAGVLNGKARSLPQPPYPPIARAARATGTVVVQVIIDERGCIQTARAVSGHPLLQAAAVQAARQACFAPTRLSGQPVKVSGVITYNFMLQ